jgi:hypothetical protein
MIRLNLYSGKKQFNIANVGGFDLSKINILAMIIVIFISYIPDMFIYDGYKADETALKNRITQMKGEHRQLAKKTKDLKSIEKQIEALKEQESRLAAKLGVVKQIIKIRNNPMNILLYIAKNLPSEIWLTRVNFREKQLVIQGQSTSYKSIGIFIENLRNSVFFNKNLRLSKSQSGFNNIFDRRTETFEIQGPVVSFE